MKNKNKSYHGGISVCSVALCLYVTCAVNENFAL